MLARIFNIAPKNITSNNKIIVITQAIKSSSPVCSCCINFSLLASFKSVSYLISPLGYVVPFFLLLWYNSLFPKALVNYVSFIVHKHKTLWDQIARVGVIVRDLHLIPRISNCLAWHSMGELNGNLSGLDLFNDFIFNSI